MQELYQLNATITHFLEGFLETAVPMIALRAMMSLLLHWEMEGGHRPANAKGEEAGEKK